MTPARGWWARFQRLSDHQKYRLLEITPGFCVWATLGLAVVFCFWRPLWVIVFILLFDLYWLIRILYVMAYILLAFRRFRHASLVNWRHKLETLPEWQHVYHAVIIPISSEPETIVRETIQSLTRIDYPLSRVIIVLAMEEREGQRLRSMAADIQRDFSGRFMNIMATEHPANIVGEVAAKGANIAWAGRQLQKWVDTQGLEYQRLLVSTFDADSVAHHHYFSYLTYTFLSHPDRQHTSYQPIPLFHNNVWEAMGLMRVVANSTTFWLLSETGRPDRLFTFSSHSMPFQALVDVGFWQTDVVNEDSRIFLQCFLQYDGHYQVTPMYIPISMDVVQGESFWKAMVNQYKQIRRWAYGGVENFPFMVWNFWKNPHLARSQKLKYAWIQWEGIYSWAVAPLIILLLGWLPFQVNNHTTVNSVLALNTPIILRYLMTSAMIGLFVSAILSTVLLPKRPQHVRRRSWLTMVFQWLLLPITMIIFGAVPALEAQTRMMLGKYLGFWVTEKTRKT